MFKLQTVYALSFPSDCHQDPPAKIKGTLLMIILEGPLVSFSAT